MQTTTNRKETTARRVSQITYKDIINGGKRAFLGGKDPIHNGDICGAETTGSGHVGVQVFQQTLKVSKELCNKVNSVSFPFKTFN